jgi:hypothetical protein
MFRKYTVTGSDNAAQFQLISHYFARLLATSLLPLALGTAILRLSANPLKKTPAKIYMYDWPLVPPFLARQRMLRPNSIEETMDYTSHGKAVSTLRSRS